jgi:DNA-binding FadR family transcriptional regulator
MNKPISKHSLRRALEKVEQEGLLQYSEPIGTVVDRIWHEIEKQTFNGGRKKPAPRATPRAAAVGEKPDLDVP